MEDDMEKTQIDVTQNRISHTLAKSSLCLLALKANPKILNTLLADLVL